MLGCKKHTFPCILLFLARPGHVRGSRCTAILPDALKVVVELTCLAAIFPLGKASALQCIVEPDRFSQLNTMTNKQKGLVKLVLIGQKILKF